MSRRDDVWIILKTHSFDFCVCCYELAKFIPFFAGSKQKPWRSVWPVTTSGVFSLLKPTKYLNFCVGKNCETSST